MDGISPRACLSGSRHVRTFGTALMECCFLVSIARTPAAERVYVAWRRRQLIFRVAAGCLIVVAFGGLIMLWPAIARGTEARVVPAPGPAGYEAVVYESHNAIDPIWSVTVRQSDGFWSKEWDVGCINGDDPAADLKSLSWRGPARLVVTSQLHEVSIPVNPTTGEPATTPSPIWNC
jgi:hypothetical protein